MTVKVGVFRAGVLLSAMLAAACEKTTRDNAFVPSLFGDGEAAAAPTLGPGADWPETAPAGRAPGSTAIRPVRRQSALQAPLIRGPAGVGDPALLRLREPVRTTPDGGVTMSFERIAVPDFARAVFGELLGLSYAVAPDLPGAVSLQVAQPVPRESVYAIAATALAAAGVGVRREGELVVVEADPRGPEAGPRPGALMLRRLRHVDRAELERALAPFTSNEARAIAGPSPDSLILAGSEDGVATLDGLVAALDIDPLANRHFGLFPLKRASSGRVAAELRRILAADGFTGAEVVDIGRINAVLVISDGRRAITEAGFWTGELDLGDVLNRQVFVYPVQNRRAVELAELLNEAFAGQGLVTAAVGAGAGDVAPGLSFAATGVSGAGGGNGESASDGALPAAASPADTLLGDAASGVAIFADDGTNSVMTIATADDYALIEAALRQLDVQPVQVLIEATIIEVSLTDALKYGVRWFFESGDVSVSFSDAATGAVAPVFPGFNFVLNSSDLRAVVSALDQVSDVQVVSAPSLMVLNNETARLQVGDEVPVATQTAEGTTEDSRIVNSITQRQTGIVLEITPRVNASGLVLLDIVQEVSSAVETDTSEINSPTIANRRIQSSVALRDRETLALGGLITSSRGRGKSGIPILSDIPVIGAAFGSTEQTADRTELLVVIRPIVVRNHNEALMAYRDLRAKLQGLGDLSQYLPQD